MASPVPAKSQPLHNFSLPHLWNGRSGRSRLAGETSSTSPPHRSPSTPWRESPPPSSHAHIPPHPLLRQSSPSYVSRRPSPLHKQSPMRDSESESEPSSAVSKGIDKHSRKIPSAKPTKSFDSSKGKRSSKICIRVKNSNIKHDDAVPAENHSSPSVHNAVPSATAEEEESLPKRNLRPRRPPMNHKQFNGGLPKIGSSSSPENRLSQINYHSKESSEGKNNDHSNIGTSKKQKFSIALSRHEIEEDIFAWTGSKPSRRPKKRPRTVQKQLDTLFPGLWLGSITADSYKVSEAPPKV